MSPGLSSPVVTQTQTKDPWSGAVPYLQQMYSTAQGFQQGDVGYQPYTGPVQAPLVGTQDVALQGLWNQAYGQASGGVPGISNAQNLGANLINAQGMTPGISQAVGGLQQAGGQLGDIYGQAMNQQNPYLQQILDTQNRRITDQIASRFSGAGRYGSGLQQDITARALGEAEAPALQADYEARQNRALQATGAQASIQNQLADIYGAGLQRAGQWAQISPTLAQAQYAPYTMLGTVGQEYQNRAQQDLAGQIALYNAQQAYPWQQLERESAILAGAGQLGGTTVGTQTTQVPWTQRLLGGALAGGGLGSAFGVGAGAGAIGGGLLGLL